MARGTSSRYGVKGIKNGYNRWSIKKEYHDRYHVEIPKGFKEALFIFLDYEERNMDESDGFYIIKNIPCPLCTEYRSDDSCGKCPFARLEIRDNFGCIEWIKTIRARLRMNIPNVSIGENELRWQVELDSSARKELDAIVRVFHKEIFVSFV